MLAWKRIFGALLTGVALAAGNSAPVHAVFGGSSVNETTHAEEFASLLFFNTGQAVCGATYIGSSKAITTAHCVLTSDHQQELPPERMLLRAGTPKRSTGGSIANVRSVHVHPDYVRKAGGANDIAVLVLDREPRGVRAALLASESAFYEDNQVGQFAGWGYTDSGSLPEIAHAVALKVRSHEYCATSFHEGMFTPSMLCAEAADDSGAGSIAKGDCGSPLLVRTERGLHVVGFASWFANPA
ncbi:MAG: trypsin-like serine protease, partial [Longispora sp.]|nr:trypsin-like serine protease [Longispora sp. (in: high G+C Gram-positive bacteria)]